ncbi:host attachment protein [Paracoccus sp. Arc7-R13]|uniref:baeRF12 domain-containing protein n=1 Tax=Paracoccus sp. Arc7-R13 TaxID=2500532 RepID=UPI000FDA9CA6|nr:host attachment protein [Paracoccus sp. Arc7-R13]AZY94323.1 host attachment protein [Paracoccus sp. Arc7-R13]TYP60750.1 protein required for attachment to host cells [Stutzerimonas stutzeri]
MLPHNALVVVADGHSATLFRNTAKSGLELSETTKVTQESLSGDGAQIDEGSPRDDEEATFAAQLSRHLNAMVLKNKFEDIAIIADPSTLGVMRKHYHKELQLRLRKEVAKTLTNSDIQTIQSSLS